MRPNNQNKRSRGRNNNGRKHSNPLSRNYESNGPDVKVRGNAAHVAEKYVQLARDAQASGDQVMAENYFQHAEHYFRIVSAAQAQMAQRNEQQPYTGTDNSDDNDDDTNDDDGVSADSDDGNESGDQPQPRRDNRRDNRRPRRNADDNQDQPVTAKSDDAGDAEPSEASAASEDDDKPAKKTRRPRRKPRSEDASDDADSSSGELPAFLTAGISAAE